MRLLAELPHPDCKITIFGMNQKFIIKFEQANLEQSYKISEMDIVGGVNGVFELLDEEFMKSVTEQFNSMRQSFNASYIRHD